MEHAISEMGTVLAQVEQEAGEVITQARQIQEDMSVCALGKVSEGTSMQKKRTRKTS